MYCTSSVTAISMDGDLDAFEALFCWHQSEVYSWIVHIVRDSATAEDLTVETFWRIYRAHARFDPTRSFGPWARRIATNTALDYLKTARPETVPPQRSTVAVVAKSRYLRGTSAENGACIPPAPAEAAGHGHTGADRRAAVQRNRRIDGHFHRSREAACLLGPALSQKGIEKARNRTMNTHEQERIKELLKKSLPPISARSGAELQFDLWPAMLRRLEVGPTAVPWFDWALLAAVAAWLAFFPGAIPVLIYHL
jgi:RNA polymerase sigma factor (sigma-70 family)